VFNELEDEILYGFVVKDENNRIGLVNVEDDVIELGIGYIFGLEVFEKNKYYGKKIIKKIFELHPTQHAFGGKSTSTSKGFWLNLGAEFDEFDEYSFILQKDKLKYDDGGSVLLAPNGKPSNLNPEQYKLVRTPAFKKWFGDWENDPANASKVVDSNGEPLVVYHGTNSEFNIFDTNSNKGSDFGSGAYFGNKKTISEMYGERIIGTFLNLRKPLILKDRSLINVIFDEFIDYKNTISNKYFTLKDYIIKNGSDGIVIYNPIMGEETDDTWFVCYEPNQIKLADGSNTTFDGNNPDIRFKEGGLIAPNGKPSNLTPEQYKLVRTPAFKKWFGDWENSPESASKVVDKNGEPKVYYQGLPYYLYPNGKNIYEEDNNGIFFTSNKKNALTYGAVKSMFIKCINPKDVRNYFGYDGKKISDNLRNDKKYNYKTKEEKQYINSDLNVIKFYEDVIDKYGKSFEILDENEGKEFIFKNKEEIKKFLIPTSEKGFLFLNFKYRSAIWNWIGNYIKNSQYDGLFATDEDSLAEEISDSIVVYNSNQIKLADGSNTTFDGNNPDIRYAGGGDVSAPKNVQIKIFDEQETYFYSAIKNQKNNDVWTFTKTSKSKATENYENTNIFQYKNYDSMLNSAKRIANDESTITIYDEQGKGKNYLLKDYFNNPDIRFDGGGDVNNKALMVNDFLNEQKELQRNSKYAILLDATWNNYTDEMRDVTDDLKNELIKKLGYNPLYNYAPFTNKDSEILMFDDDSNLLGLLEFTIEPKYTIVPRFSPSDIKPEKVFENNNNVFYIEYIFSFGKGKGQKMMNQIKKYANKYNVAIGLEGSVVEKSVGKYMASAKHLERFYDKQGFVNTDGNYYLYSPNSEL
jgi:hypothetical protein